MADGLDVIVVDDDPSVLEIITDLIKEFYMWGEVIGFSDPDEAVSYCLNRDIGIAIFILDVFLGETSGFDFLDRIEEKFPSARDDSIIVTGHASDDIVNMCIYADVTHLVEKPIRPFALQLAVRSIVMKYLAFAKRLMGDSAFAANVSRVNL
jgi:DNA-binding NarL/FixJ family response regulator